MTDNGPREKSRSRKRAIIGERRRRSGSGGISVYIDTEFNAFDYYGQNEGCQEIIEIGIAVMLDGEVRDKFNSLCRLTDGHTLSRRTSKLTGITREDLKASPSFPEVLSDMNAFLDQYDPKYIYAYGNEDKLQLANTANLYGLDEYEQRYIDRVRDNLRTLNKMLGIERKNLTLSVKDLCIICGFDADNTHNAYYDALYLARCSEAIYSGNYAPEDVQNIFERKAWMAGYHSSRRIREKRDDLVLTDREIDELQRIIDRLHTGSQYKDYLFSAIMDDLLMMSGRDPQTEHI